MVKLVDLEEHAGNQCLVSQDALALDVDDRPNPNFDSQFAAALSCYPIVSQLASYVDLNTLHELSRTCRQFRANLLQYRKLLIEQTLRCENEKANLAQRLGDALNTSLRQWTTYARTGTQIDRISGGKVGACARDMVGECRRCSRMVCRNCIMKRPQESVLNGRHRRLCRTCMKSPVDQLFRPSPHVARDSADDPDSSTHPNPVRRDPCTCRTLLWICQPCGQYLRSHDTTYLRGWTWRTRYSVCGGMGAGLGEGNEGVQCGRGADCLAAQEVVREIEVDAQDLGPSTAGEEQQQQQQDGRPCCKRRTGSGYLTGEIVGIGGNLKTKLKEMVRVGAIVKEYEDERATCSGFLQREQDGVNRSWCSWCDRVVLGKKDLDGAGKSSESVASSSSSTESATGSPLALR